MTLFVDMKDVIVFAFLVLMLAALGVLKIGMAISDARAKRRAKPDSDAAPLADESVKMTPSDRERIQREAQSEALRRVYERRREAIRKRKAQRYSDNLRKAAK